LKKIRSDHHATMIELGILGSMAEWLAPLPDKSLPNINIREQLIDALRDVNSPISKFTLINQLIVYLKSILIKFGEINADYLKSSGIGKAVMFLYKHPKETKPNKIKLEKLIRMNIFYFDLKLLIICQVSLI
jgi:transcription factor SPN1